MILSGNMGSRSSIRLSEEKRTPTLPSPACSNSKPAESVVAIAVAEVYAFRGQSDQALYWLERAYAQKERYLFYIKADRLLKNIESDPRFKAIVHKMNLPD